MLQHELIPATTPDSRRLMIVLHGLGDSTEGYRWLPPALDLPWLNYLLVNAPDPYYSGFAWYDFGADAETGIVRSRRMLFDLLEAQEAKGFPPGQTIVFGFSQGCLMVWEIGLRYPKELAGLIGISGYVHEPVRSLKELSPVANQQRFLITHGVLDSLIPFEDAKRQVQIIQAGGIQVQWMEFEKAHAIEGEEELSVIREFVRSRFPAKPSDFFMSPDGEKS
jgi:phospholipase/carboxylesterase